MYSFLKNTPPPPFPALNLPVYQTVVFAVNVQYCRLNMKVSFQKWCLVCYCIVYNLGLASYLTPAQLYSVHHNILHSQTQHTILHSETSTVLQCTSTQFYTVTLAQYVTLLGWHIILHSICIHSQTSTHAILHSQTSTILQCSSTQFYTVRLAQYFTLLNQQNI